MRVEACPKRSATMRFDTPPWISQLASVRLRSFGVTRGTPARAQARARSRVTLDHGLTTGPLPRWSAARIGLISSWIGTERLTVLPIGTAIMPRCRYQVVRFDPKEFRQRRPDPEHPDRWIWKLGDVRRVLYRLDRVREADPTRRSMSWRARTMSMPSNLGLVATCNPQGA